MSLLHLVESADQIRRSPWLAPQFPLVTSSKVEALAANNEAYDEANGTDPFPDQVKKACIISNTPEPLKTHLQLNVSNLGTFDALRVATKDYLRSRRIFKTTSAGVHPGFAPQFPLVGCTNVEAVTANNATLRHYGRKVACGHVTTNSGKRVLMQITFDVMSVRKPFRSTSALKHRGVTIIFNHDYDRIIFRNETVNLISHDCHTYLCLPLANGIPHRKAMVMAGGNVSNDVDEEVYVGDGVESQEAQEASAGDMRAIADADQAGQLDVSGETRAARALRTPEPPTDAARMVHNTTHVPFRDWCPFCVAS